MVDVAAQAEAEAPSVVPGQLKLSVAEAGRASQEWKAAAEVEIALVLVLGIQEGSNPSPQTPTQAL